MNEMPLKSLLVVDDHPVYRDALTDKLSHELVADGITVEGVASVSLGLELVENSFKRWVVLLDILMPGLSGLAAIKIFKSNPNVDHVVAISGVDKHAWEPRTVSAGATLFLSKNNTADYIVEKIRPYLFGVEINRKNLFTPVQKEYRLTQRQLEVLTLVSQGHSNKIIADFLDITEQTVKIHITQIFKELRVFNRTQAVLKAQKNNLLP